jgi:flagellar basal body-associated protein FliL
MSTTLVAALLAIAGVVAVAGVSWVFYLVGRAEDRERAEAERQRRPPPPPPAHEDHPERNGKIARERRRPLPPRRPL